MKRRHLGLLTVLTALACGDDSGDDDGAADTTSNGGTTGADTTDAGDDVGADTGGDTGDTSADTGAADTTGGPAEADVSLSMVVEGLVAPTDMATAPDGTLVVLDQPGTAYTIADGALEAFADLTDRVIELNPDYDERGLLGLAFAPGYPEDARVFVYYSAPLREGAPEDFDHTNVLSEFTVDAGTVDPASERELLAVDWPYSNHNGGELLFGPDGLLYLAMGDGGNANDVGIGHPPLGNGQDYSTLQGSILRIDPDAAMPYGIPEDNPFVDVAEAADEIYAYGLRNPYSFSFDAQTGELFSPDVGQNLMEEVDIIEAGDNLGWNIKEGTLCFDPDAPEDPPAQCPMQGPQGNPLVDPILTYTHPDTSVSDMSEVHGISVVGGFVYRGTALAGFEGDYVFGDFSRSFMDAQGQLLLGERTDDGWELRPLRAEGTPEGHLGVFLRNMGQDADGELYLLTSQNVGPSGETGAVWRLAPPAR